MNKHWAMHLSKEGKDRGNEGKGRERKYGGREGGSRNPNGQWHAMSDSAFYVRFSILYAM